ncbi:MAG: phage terminase large subunit [Acetobacteraceae bacterium]
MTALTLPEYHALLRQDFCSFLERCFYELNPGATFLANWHLEVMAARLTAVRAGKIRRLIINVPPRHLKSLAASVALPAWWLGHDPAAQVLCVSYAHDLADKHARDCRRIMQSDWYRALFATRLSADRQAVGEFVTTAQGYRLSTSVGGVLTGRGADVIIIDDPLKPEEALSDRERETVNEWYDHTLLSRLNDKRTGAIVLIMQRLHEDDLTGHVQAAEEWNTLALSAIAAEDEEHCCDTAFGSRRFRRRAGEPLHPAREPLAILEELRRTLGPYHFAGQYQQAPAPLGGGMIKGGWFLSYTPATEPTPFDRILQSWDTANKATELADYSVCTTWGLKDRHLYLLHLLRKRLDYPNLKRAVREQVGLYPADVILIEDKASGTQLIQELTAEGLYAVTRYAPSGDKIMRLHAVTAMIENGFVHLPATAPWLADYLHELTTFPKGRHDDQADSTAQALDWVKQDAIGPGGGRHMLAYYEQLIAEANGKPPRRPDPLPWRTRSDQAAARNLYTEAYNQLQARLFTRYCAHCGEIITPGTTYINDGVATWHQECHQAAQRRS